MDILNALDVNNTKNSGNLPEKLKKNHQGNRNTDEISNLIIEAYNALCHRIEKKTLS
jgi:pyruvate,water dikinase